MIAKGKLGAQGCEASHGNSAVFIKVPGSRGRVPNAEFPDLLDWTQSGDFSMVLRAICVH
jgi:hypothetical protein